MTSGERGPLPPGGVQRNVSKRMKGKGLREILRVRTGKGVENMGRDRVGEKWAPPRQFVRVSKERSCEMGSL